MIPPGHKHIEQIGAKLDISVNNHNNMNRPWMPLPMHSQQRKKYRFYPSKYHVANLCRMIYLFPCLLYLPTSILLPMLIPHLSHIKNQKHNHDMSRITLLPSENSILGPSCIFWAGVVGEFMRKLTSSLRLIYSPSLQIKSTTGQSLRYKEIPMLKRHCSTATLLPPFCTPVEEINLLFRAFQSTRGEPNKLCPVDKAHKAHVMLLDTAL